MANDVKGAARSFTDSLLFIFLLCHQVKYGEGSKLPSPPRAYATMDGHPHLPSSSVSGGSVPLAAFGPYTDCKCVGAGALLIVFDNLRHNEDPILTRSPGCSCNPNKQKCYEFPWI